MLVVTWNVNSLRVRLEHVLQYLKDAKPDVLCLQETKVTDDKFPLQALLDAGYDHIEFYGQKTYNGVAILSKHPITDVQKGFTEGEPDEQTRLIVGTVKGVRIFNCYVPMGTAPDSPKFRYKLMWFARLRGELNKLNPEDPVLVCGDLNVALEHIDTWNPLGSEGHILCHPHERMVLKKVMAWGLHDSWRHQYPKSNAYSWWDYRAGAFQKNHGYRIDYVMVTASLLERVTGGQMWRDCRTWQPTASDHIPVGAWLDVDGL